MEALYVSQTADPEFSGGGWTPAVLCRDDLAPGSMRDKVQGRVDFFWAIGNITSDQVAF